MIKVFFEHKLSSLIVLLFFVIFLTLGSWQIYRYQEKTKYIETIYSSLKEEPIEINEDAKLTPFSNITISGEMLIDKYFWLYRRHPLAKQQDGAYLAVPLRDDYNHIFLVILGWVEKSKQADMIKEIMSLDKKLIVTGLLLNSERNSIFIPENDYKNRVYFTMSIPDISNKLDVKLEEYFIAMLQANNKFDTQILPISPDMMIKVKNDHIEYATTWYAIAMSLMLIYYILLKRKNKNV